ncbi:putative eukaryotic translation initiation factor 3 subunit EifCj [Xylaria sp. FL0933]|nr:putative eukaryotic translation initiation factor 3 subunit EifCj [Xylaria sp. FL0933]
MPAAKQWEEEESESSSSEASPQIGAVRRNKFADEEEDSDVLESWDAAEDSEVEREKAKKAAEAKAKAEAEAAANKKSRTQRIAERQAEKARRLAEEEEESSEEEETPAQRAQRLKQQEKEADLKHAEDLFGGAGLSLGTGTGRKTATASSVVQVGSDPNNTVDLAAMPLFNPTTKSQFETLRNTIVPIITSSSRKAHYALFLQEFAKQLAKDLPSDQIKKISSTLTTLSNEKMKEEKAGDKSSKKTKAQKTKTQLVTNRPNTTDVGAYDDDAFGDDDFM